MKKSTLNIKYTGTTVENFIGRCGLNDCGDISCLFRGKKFRDKAIFRFDCFRFLEPYFLQSTLTKYRGALWQLIFGKLTDEQQITDIVKELMSIDNRFNSFVSTTWYTLAGDKDLGNTILDTLANALNREDYFREYLVGSPQFVIAESQGYMYMSVPDGDINAILPRELDLEVLSYAKSWSGTYSICQ